MPTSSIIVGKGGIHWHGKAFKEKFQNPKYKYFDRLHLSGSHHHYFGSIYDATYFDCFSFSIS